MLKPIAWANAIATTSALFYTILWAMSYLLPTFYSTIVNAQFLGADIASSTPFTTDPTSAGVNLVVLAASTWVMGYVWASLYNRFNKGK